MSMIGDCWNCGEKFRFNEAKIKHMALITCPNCKERVLIEASVKDGVIDYSFNPPPLLNKKKKEQPLKAPGEEGVRYSPERARKAEGELSVDLDDVLGTAGNDDLMQRLKNPVQPGTQARNASLGTIDDSSGNVPEWERRGGGEGMRSRVVDQSLRQKVEQPAVHKPALTPQKAGMTPRREADPFTGVVPEGARRPIPQPAPADSGYLDFDLPQAATMSASGSPMPRSAEDSTEAHNLELRHAEADYSGEEEIRSLTEQAKREALQAADPAQTQPPLSGARPVPPKRLDPVMSSRPKRPTKPLTPMPAPSATETGDAVSPSASASSLPFSEPALPSDQLLPGAPEPPMGGLRPSTPMTPTATTQAMTTPAATPQLPKAPSSQSVAEESGEIMRDLLSEQMYAMQESTPTLDESAPVKRGERSFGLPDTAALVAPQPALEPLPPVAPPMPPRQEPASRTPQAAKRPRAVAPLERDTRTTLRAKGSMVSLVGTLVFAALAIVAGVILASMNPDWFGSPTPPAVTTENEEAHLGKFFVEELIKDAGLVATDGGQLMNEAELEFGKDDAPHYQKAQTLFHQALAKQPDNPLAIAWYVETSTLLPDRSTKIEDIKRHLKMLDYAETLKASKQAKAGIARAKARVYLVVDNIDKALAMAEQAVEQNGDDFQNKVALAEIHLHERPEQTISLLEPLLVELHYPLRTLRLLHAAYRQNGRLKKAEDMALKRQEIDPDSCATCADLGYMYLDLGKTDQAERQFTLLQAKQPNSAVGAIGKALAAFANQPGNVSAVQDILNQIPASAANLMTKADRADLSCWRARFYLAAKREADAIHHAEAAMALDPLKPEAVYLKTLAEIWRGEDIAKKADDWQRLLEEVRFGDQQAYQIPMLRGYLNQKEGDLKDALTQYEIAHKMAPRQTMPLLLLADLSMETDIVSSAEEYLSKLLVLGPEHQSTHEQVSLYLERFDFGKLVERLTRIDNHRMDIDRKWTLVGLSNYLAGNRNAAMMNFQKVLYNNPRHHNALLFQAAISGQLGKTQEAIRLLETLLKSYSEDVQARIMLARLYRQAKRSEDAYRILNEAERLKLVHAELSSELALLAKERGDDTRAAGKAGEAWRLDPQNRRVLSSLYQLGI